MKTKYILILLFLILLSLSGFFFLWIGTKPLPIKSHTMWNEGKSDYLKLTEYTLGVLGGGYLSIEINGKEILRYDDTEIYGRWKDKGTVKLVSNEPPIKKWLQKTNIAFELIQAVDYDDFVSDSLLVHLTKVAH